jgi:hypothetical protein
MRRTAQSAAGDARDAGASPPAVGSRPRPRTDLGHDEATPHQVRRTLILVVAAVLASSSAGVPHDLRGAESLPSAAMGWRLLFHVERAGALLGVGGITLLIAWRGSRGEWPVRFGNVEYAPKEAIAVTADALEKQDRRLRMLEAELRADDR